LVDTYSSWPGGKFQTLVCRVVRFLNRPNQREVFYHNHSTIIEVILAPQSHRAARSPTPHGLAFDFLSLFTELIAAIK